MAITPEVIAEFASEEIPRIFGDAIENERRGQPDFIANGEPASITGQIAQATSRAACRRYGSNPGGVPAGRAANFERACRPYLDSIEPSDGVGIGIPFEGGQCAGTVYQFLYSDQTSPSPLGFINSNAKSWGPIGGVRTEMQGTRLKGFLISGGPITAESCGVGAGSPGPVQERELFDVQFRGQTGGTFTITGICSGDDNCGNPPPVVRQPPPVGDPTPPPFRFNPGPDIDIDIDVQVGPDGDIVFDIGTGPITIDPFPDGGGDDGGDEPGGGGGPGDGPAGDPGTPGSPQETGQNETAEGCAPEGSVISGLRINIIGTPPTAREFSPGVFRAVAYIYMGYPGLLDLVPDGASLRSGQFVIPDANNLTCYRVDANLGFNLRVTPYYRQVPE